MMEKVVRNGLVAVLYSPEYGAGWSSWEGDPAVAKAMLFDRRLVEAAERNVSEDEVKLVLREIFSKNYSNIYTGGWKDIKIGWVEEGKLFRIDEYDGAEAIVKFDPADLYIA